METQSSGELDCENDATPSVRSNPRTVRKAISLKLKGKGKGGKGGRGRTTRAAKKAEEAAAVLDVTAVASESQSSKSEVLTEVEPMEQDKPTFDMEQDIFKLEAPTFTTIDRGPPEPIHNNSKLRWDHKVSLMGAKVLNPAIHVCKICSLPILLYGRMIPCKHVFCYECAVKSEKICPRCHEKVTRVEHTGLGTIHICIFGATKRNGSDGCNRTYLSHRDLQAHINHRHLRQPATTTAAPAPTNNVTTTAKTGEGGRSAGGGGGSSSLTLSHSHHHHSPASALDYRTRGHSRGHPAESNYRSSQVAMNAYTSEVQHGYDQRTNQLLAVAGGAAQQTVLTPYSLTVVPQTVSAAVALQQQVVAAATVANISGVQGVTYTTAIPVMSVQAASNMPQARTNLITVPIHDDSNANAAAEYLYQQQQQQQQQQAFQMPPLVGPPYTAPPPSVTYQTTATYVGTPQAPVTSFPPPPYPPPPIYQPGQLPPPPPPAHMHPQPRYPTGPIPMRPRFGTPPPPAHYEDHSHLASMQYPPNLWTQQQQQQAQQTQARSNGPPPLIQPQQRFY